MRVRVRVRTCALRAGILALTLTARMAEGEREKKSVAEREESTKRAELTERLSDTRLTSLPMCLVLHQAC